MSFEITSKPVAQAVTANQAAAAPPVAASTPAPPADRVGTAREVPAALLKLTQRQLELAPEGLRALHRYYGLPEASSRNAWTHSTDLRSDTSGKADTVSLALAGTKPIATALVTDVAELLVPNVGEVLKAKGFVADVETIMLLLQAGAPGAARAAMDARSNRVEVQVSAVDHEGLDRLGGNRAGAKARNLAESIVEGKKPTTKREMKRVLQRVAIYFDKGAITDVYILTYSWPPRGLPGMNEENVHYSAKYGTRRVLINHALAHCVAIGMGDQLPFYADLHAPKGAK